MNRLREQDGFAIPIAIWMLMLGLLFGTLAMSQAMLGLRGANSSWSSTRAHAAAEAAGRMAVYHVNTLGLDGAAVTHLGSTLDWTQCPVQAAAGDPIATATISVGKAWCDPVPVDLGGGATATYQLSSIVNCNVEMGYNPLPALLALGTIQDCLKRKIVATGTVDGVSRRIYEEIRASDSANVVASVIGPNVLGSVSLQ